jgi:hypothetical protein
MSRPSIHLRIHTGNQDIYPFMGWDICQAILLLLCGITLGSLLAEMSKSAILFGRKDRQGFSNNRNSV